MANIEHEPATERYRDVMRGVGHWRSFAWLAAKLAPLDAKVLKKTGGKFGLLGNYNLPQCLLTTTGRKSGQKRTVTLLYGDRGDDLVLIGSNFGQKNHPAWALNLEANPAAVVQIGEDKRALTARLVTDEVEREEIWEFMYGIWPAYAAYRGRAGRDILVFSLT